MGGLGRHPYSHDPYQRQGNNMIMLRPVMGSRGYEEYYLTFDKYQQEVDGYQTKEKYYRDPDSVPTTDPLAYPGLWNIRQMVVNHPSGGIRIGTVCPASKIKSDTITLECGFYDEEMMEIPELHGTATIDHSVSYSTDSVTGVVTIVEIHDFNSTIPIRGKFDDIYNKTIVSEGLVSTANLIAPVPYVNSKPEAAYMEAIATMDIPT